MSDKKITDQDYLFLSAMVKARESKMLTADAYERMLTAPDFGCHPCVNTSSLRLSTADLLTKFLPAVHHEYTPVTLTSAE